MGLAINAKAEKNMDPQVLFHRFRYHLASGFCTLDDVVLDLGCGTGYGSKIMSEKALEVRAFDMEQANIDAARSNNYAFNVVHKVANLEKMEIPDCDVAVSFEVIEHLYDPRAFVEKIKAKTRKFIVVSVPLDQTLIMVDGDPQEEHDSTHHAVFTKDEFDSMFIDDNWRTFFSWRDGVTYISIYYNNNSL